MDSDRAKVYASVPLDRPDHQIRLLKFKFGKKSHARIDCQILVCDLAHGPIYHAISYTWGDPNDTNIIYIDGIAIEVGQNAYYALWQARDFGARYVWIDAICINQQDLDEKGVQVAMMFKVFEASSQVFACLGPEAEAVEHILSILPDIENVLESVPQHYIYGKNFEGFRHVDWQPWIAAHDEDYMVSLCNAFNDLGARPYFHRLWVAQELKAGGPRTKCLAGRVAINWRMLVEINKILMIAFRGSRFYGYACTLNHEIPWMMLLLHRFTDRFLEYTEFVSHLRCTDRRDYIYGTLNFVNWSKYGLVRPTPDYGKDLYPLAVETAMLIGDGDNAISTLENLVRCLRLQVDDLPSVMGHESTESQPIKSWSVAVQRIARVSDVVNLSYESVTSDDASIQRPLRPVTGSPYDLLVYLRWSEFAPAFAIVLHPTGDNGRYSVVGRRRATIDVDDDIIQRCSYSRDCHRKNEMPLVYISFSATAEDMIRFMVDVDWYDATLSRIGVFAMEVHHRSTMSLQHLLEYHLDRHEPGRDCAKEYTIDVSTEDCSSDSDH